MEKILSVEDLHISFDTTDGEVKAVRGVSFDLYKGETLAVVGESGSGKSVMCKSIMGLIPKPAGKVVSGSIWYEQRDIANYSNKEFMDIRGSGISVIFQDPMTSLNPTMTVGKQIREGILAHQQLSKREANERTVELLDLVGINHPEERLKQYPHQLSGGMQQRVVIAMALSSNPEIIIADEPTTALDVTVQAQVLDLLKEIQRKKKTSIIFITHDLGVVANVADRVAVMYAGKIVEVGKTNEVFYNPQHPYTTGLLAAMPDLHTDQEELEAIPGAPPNLLHPPKGDAFALRNPLALKIDFLYEPPMFQVSETHFAATWLLHKKAAGKKKGKQAGQKLMLNEKQSPSKTVGKEKLLEVNGLALHFKSGKNNILKAVDGITFHIFKGETFGLVGESGCGKSTTGRTLTRLYEPTAGEILFKGTNMHGRHRMNLHKDIQMIFQDPYSSLDPRWTVGDIISEGMDIYQLYTSGQERTDKVYELLETVGLRKEHANRYPHEFSGGQRQRIGIARALAVDPEFIIADEPISALDVSIQAQIINLMKRLQRENGLTYLFIAHDLSMVKYISDRIGVMYQGKLVEVAESDTLYQNPLHPYTKTLLSAIPVPDPKMEKKRIRLPKQDWTVASADCLLREVTKDHWVLCNEEEYERLTKETCSHFI
ncbi:peptide/nickel transport system ATP-binding protein [Bacillus thermophilus]|uniref:Peptide/nickel transport system ATP-binding protein n=2 Tax=Siminovitchia TaxID=2837510 RepID=A0ABS2R5H5_9BACI|nr:ABC transporter ATP-binding protein [Siminovitchia thermophila]MBM7714854.1 peptide/nickel transport system ATP-binding protein [Siminovitchia thermophila]ONK21802.1 ABC transporter ATP-binding protein [Bacillus sp. VT-16-64]